MGNVSSWKYIDVPTLPYANQGKGIIGFLGSGASSFKPQAPSWFANLARHNLISEHRFGLAFGTSGKGQIVIGQVDTNLIDGPFTTVERVAVNGSYEGSYTVLGDFTVNGTIFAKDQVIIMDVGTDNIQGPLSVTKKMFDSFGWQTNLKVKPPPPGGFNNGQGSAKTLLGYFDCSKPPTIGFSFPATSQLKKGQKGTNFNVSPDVWDVYEHKHDAGNCTSILGGINALGTTWLLGQSFFAGHYIDFNVQNETISYANLKDSSGGS
ncbi:aspartic peptidase domain-containing protein [Neohortaea acidophila]|uniref:Aspartic peptidase domain-containing protein n=1 Tax=Neohortaea acidophila TaxID=245834 RepID=A0A6A6PY68_9PEZI|nr:aspartic peptidase domain-containing protein [Neohortaea acidophila]KAF2484716.1 aspartic peptidase domain-containing protein [Neohortaea acidophila]